MSLEYVISVLCLFFPHLERSSNIKIDNHKNWILFN